jgi:hypothetical protein
MSELAAQVEAKMLALKASGYANMTRKPDKFALDFNVCLSNSVSGLQAHKLIDSDLYILTAVSSLSVFCA